MSKQLGGAGVYVVCEHEGVTGILSVSRKENSEIFGIPAGKQEPGETIRETAIRETLEKTGYTVKLALHKVSKAFKRKSPDGTRMIYVFAATIDTSVPRKELAVGETGLVRTLTKDRLLCGDFAEFNAAMLEHFQHKETAVEEPLIHELPPVDSYEEFPQLEQDEHAADFVASESIVTPEEEQDDDDDDDEGDYDDEDEDEDEDEDDGGSEQEVKSKKWNKECKFCGKKDLVWKEILRGKFVLVTKQGKLHLCRSNGKGTKSCRACKKDRLTWIQHGPYWYLVDEDAQIHTCPEYINKKLSGEF